jgi:cytidylate kinase
MQQRDARDQGRDASPLVPAEDSFLLDTSDLDADQAFTSALEFIASREPFG